MPCGPLVTIAIVCRTVITIDCPMVSNGVSNTIGLLKSFILAFVLSRLISPEEKNPAGSTRLDRVYTRCLLPFEFESNVDAIENDDAIAELAMIFSKSIVNDENVTDGGTIES